jgi:hypothetical protein
LLSHRQEFPLVFKISPHGLSQESSFSSYQVTSFGSYVSYPEALTSGFAKPFYLSSSLSSIEKVVDAISIVPKGKEVLGAFSSKIDTVSGSYLKPLQSALSYSSDFTMLKEGRIPEKRNEVCLSSGLYSKLGLPSKVFVTGWVGEEEVGDRLEKDYRLGEVSVVGVVEEEKDVLFADSYWAIDFWRDEFGMSAFYLEPDKVIFHLKNASQSEAVVPLLGKDILPFVSSTPPAASLPRSTKSSLTSNWSCVWLRGSALRFPFCFY